MLSGNGRHRRPRQAPALLVAAGVTGSAIAIPFLGATGASAADGSVWDKVADCESGGSWSADTGNGSYGGLQLTQEDWEKYGGLEYAESPDLASRSQQIAVAQDILADQGVDAWRTCGQASGLTEKSGSADVDTGVEDDSPSETPGSSGFLDSPNSSNSSSSSNSSNSSNSSESSESSGSSDLVGTSSGSSGDSSGTSSEPFEDSSSSPSSPSLSSSPYSPLPSEADDSVKSDTSLGAPFLQSPDGSPVEVPRGSDQVKWEREVGSWSFVDTGVEDDRGAGYGRHRGASADESGSGGGASVPFGRHASYEVRPGDTLASIADSLGLDGGWRALYEANKSVIGADVNRIAAGQTLDVPVG